MASPLYSQQLSWVAEVKPYALGNLPSAEFERHRMEVAIATLDAIATLEHQIRQLKAKGIAPTGAWIECGRVKGRKFRQASWRAEQAIFTSSRGRGLVKSQYIGEEGSLKHQEAIASRSRREELRRLQLQLRMLQAEMDPQL